MMRPRQVTDTVGDAVGQVTDTVGDAVGQVTDTVGDAVGQVTQTAGDETRSSSPGTAGEAAKTGKDDSSSPRRNGPSDEPSQRSNARPSTHAPISGPTFAGVVLSEQMTDEVGERTDPCETRSRSVCLGVLYGLGEFNDDGAAVVLGIVATTGIAIIGLIMIALGLGASGSALVASGSALVATSSRVAVPAGVAVSD